MDIHYFNQQYSKNTLDIERKEIRQIPLDTKLIDFIDFELPEHKKYCNVKVDVIDVITLATNIKKINKNIKILCMLFIPENFDDYIDIETDTYATYFLCRTNYKKIFNKIKKNDVKGNNIIFEHNCIVLSDSHFKPIPPILIYLGIVPIINKKKNKREPKKEIPIPYELSLEEFVTIFNRLETFFQTGYRSHSDILILTPYDPYKIDQAIIIDIYNYLIAKYGFLFKHIYICISNDMTTNRKIELEEYKKIFELFDTNIIKPQDFLKKK